MDLWNKCTTYHFIAILLIHNSSADFNMMALPQIMSWKGNEQILYEITCANLFHF